MRELWKRIVPASGTRIYSALIGVLVLSITAYHLGPEGRGQLATATTWGTMFATLGSLSLGQIAIHRASAAGPDAEVWLSEAFAVLVWSCGVVTLASWSVAFVAYWNGASFGGLRPEWLLVACLAIPMLVWEQYGGSLLMAREQLHTSNRAQVLGRSVTAVAVFAFVGYAGWGVTGALVGTLVGQSLSAGWVFASLWRSVRRLAPPSLQVWRHYVVDGLKLHLNAVGAFLMSGADVLMVNHFSGAAAAGFYQLGAQLVGLMLIIPQAVAMVAYGLVSKLGADAAWPKHRRLLLQTMLLMLAAALAAGLTAPWWLTLIAGPRFEATIELFRWQLLALLGLTFSTVMAPQWIARGFFWRASLLTLGVGATGICAAAVLVPLFGAKGAAWSSLGASVLALAASLAMMKFCDSRSTRAAS